MKIKQQFALSLKLQINNLSFSFLLIRLSSAFPEQNKVFYT
jgi:hypothetical protein